MQCALWIAFLRHYPRHLRVSFDEGSENFLYFLKVLTGGGNRTWGEWLLGYKPDVKACYYIMCVAAGMSLPVAAHRWFLGLQWLGFMSAVPKEAGGVAIFGMWFVAYVIWLHRKCLSRKQAETSRTSGGDI